MKLVKIVKKLDASAEAMEFEERLRREEELRTWAKQMDAKYHRMGRTNLSVFVGGIRPLTLKITVLVGYQTSGYGSEKSQVQELAKELNNAIKAGDQVAAECKKKFPGVKIEW